eukprot:tig00000144_g9098.t1
MSAEGSSSSMTPTIDEPPMSPSPHLARVDAVQQLCAGYARLLTPSCKDQEQAVTDVIERTLSRLDELSNVVAVARHESQKQFVSVAGLREGLSNLHRAFFIVDSLHEYVGRVQATLDKMEERLAGAEKAFNAAQMDVLANKVASFVGVTVPGGRRGGRGRWRACRRLWRRTSGRRRCCRRRASSSSSRRATASTGRSPGRAGGGENEEARSLLGVAAAGAPAMEFERELPEDAAPAAAAPEAAPAAGEEAGDAAASAAAAEAEKKEREELWKALQEQRQREQSERKGAAAAGPSGAAKGPAAKPDAKKADAKAAEAEAAPESTPAGADAGDEAKGEPAAAGGAKASPAKKGKGKKGGS